MVGRSPEPQALTAELPRFVTGHRSTGWWAIVLLVLIEVMVFSSLIVSYFYFYSGAPQWPPEGIEPPKLLLPSFNALFLFASAAIAWFGDRAMARGNSKRFLMTHIVATLLLIVFLTLKYIEYSGLDYQWDTHAYGSIVWMITGFHTAHVITILLKTIPIQVLAAKGFWSPERRSAVQGATLYWIFVATVWVPLFATIYLFPHAL